MTTNGEERSRYIKQLEKYQNVGGRNSLVLVSICCCCRRLEFCSQNSYIDSQPHLTPVRGSYASFLTPQDQLCTWYTYTHASKKNSYA